MTTPSPPSAAFFTEIKSKDAFFEILKQNPGYIILKFGAEWCGPCKAVAPHINGWKSKLGGNVQYYDIDIDNSVELYVYLKARKMVNGIPCILVYKRGNTTYIPDDAALGANVFDINHVFDNVIQGTL
jgi:thioredoxin 1